MTTYVKPIYNEDGTIHSFGAGVNTKNGGMVWYAAGYKDVQTALEEATAAREYFMKEFSLN